MENVRKFNKKEIVLIALIIVLAVTSVLPYLIGPGSKRYADRQVDTSAYNSLVRYNDSIQGALDSIMLIHQKLSADFNIEVNMQMKRKMFIDSVYNLIDRRLDTIYSDHLSSAMLLPYEEFALSIISIPYEEVVQHCNFLSITDDVELTEKFQSFFDTRNMEYFNQAHMKVKSKPSFFNAGLSEEETRFYDSLYLAKLPYEPYRP